MPLALIFGDLHGRIRAMYGRAERWQRENGRTVDVILQVGDFGIYPVPERQEPKKVVQYGPGEYAQLGRERWSAPIPTYFCKGNNEDFEALASPLLPGLHYVADGAVMTFGNTRIAFLGGAWSRKSYESREPKAKHIPRGALESLYREQFDVLISHEAPGGLRFPGHVYAVGAPPLRELIETKQPRLVFHGHHHLSMVTHIGRTEVVSLGRFTARQRTDRCVYPLEL